jgi:hypothetical protein
MIQFCRKRRRKSPVLFGPQPIAQAPPRHFHVVIGKHLIFRDTALEAAIFGQSDGQKIFLRNDIRILALAVGHIETHAVQHTSGF